MKEVQVGSLMNRSVVTVTIDTSLSLVVNLMCEQRVSCVVVIDENMPIGIITESDIVKILGDIIDEKCTTRIQAKGIMTTSPVVVPQTAPLFEALVVTQSRCIRHLPVVDDNNVLSGILSYTDLAQAYERIIEQQREIIEEEANFETHRLREVNAQLKSLSMEDGLLRIGNRRSMEVDLCYTHNMALRYQRPYSIALFDVDFFKLYNDHYGHQAGDEALKLIADHVLGEIQKTDRLYRYGGEELLLLMPETGAEGANITSHCIVVNLADRNVPHAKSSYGVLTMSGGVTAIDLSGDGNPDWRSLVELADIKLYEAKQSGRNRITAADVAVVSESEQAAGQS